MNILDENIAETQRVLLSNWRIKNSQIGFDFSEKGIKDENIIPILHKLSNITFFTRDIGFYNRSLCHKDYCLVCLDVKQYEVASFIRRFFKHPLFDIKSKRMGKVVRLSSKGIQLWGIHAEKENKLEWFLNN